MFRNPPFIVTGPDLRDNFMREVGDVGVAMYIWFG